MSFCTRALAPAIRSVAAPISGDDEQDVGGEHEEGVHPRDQVDARRHHGGRMDEGAHRRGTGHGVGQPGLERELGGLPDRAAEEQGRGRGCDERSRDPQPGRPQARSPVSGGCRGWRRCRKRPIMRAVSPMRVTTKALIAARRVRRLPVPEADEEVGAQAHALPPEIEQKQVVRKHEDEHGADEEVHVGEEAAIALIPFHEADGIEVDEEGDDGDDGDHHEGEAVEVKADAGRKAARGKPGPEGPGIAESRQEGHG